jgi:hypothetical protein
VLAQVEQDLQAESLERLLSWVRRLVPHAGARAAAAAAAAEATATQLRPGRLTGS